MSPHILAINDEQAILDLYTFVLVGHLSVCYDMGYGKDSFLRQPFRS